MKNIEALAMKTKSKMQHKYTAANEAHPRYIPERNPESQYQVPRSQQRASMVEQRAIDRQRDYFAQEYEETNQRRSVQQGAMKPKPTREEAVHTSNIDPALYNNPNADKEVLNLVDSQFGKGFLELNFDDDEPTDYQKKPMSNPNYRGKTGVEFDFNEPKSAKQPKRQSSRHDLRQGKFGFDSYQNEFSTNDHKVDKKEKFSLNDFEVPKKHQNPPKKYTEHYDEEEEDDNRYQGFEGFNDFNNYVAVFD